MYFKRIEMHGFKSFAEPVTIEFHEGITCIVGPNGSGKSNISDAIRWVLGEQSPKMLRGGKMEEIIFAGTESRKSRGMAEVTLVIDNSTGILPVDYNEVAITRRMYRSGESEYAINSNQCRLRDIRELIMDTGIGVDGYSLIGQGKIADIVSNKTESRREIFEEAAGIVMYRTKKAEAERKLASTSANLERVNDIIGEQEARLPSLKEDSIKATEYLKLKDRYKELEINITLQNIENIELKSEYIKDELMETAAGIETLKDEKSQVDKELEESRSRSQELEKLAGEAQEKLLKSIEELNNLKNRGEVNSERMLAIENNTKRLEGEIADFKIKKESEEKNAREIFAGKKQIDDEMAQLQKVLDDQIDRYNSTTGESARLTESIDKNKDKIFRLTGEINTKRSEVSSMDNLKSTLERRKEQISEEKGDKEDSNREILDNMNRMKSQRELLSEEIGQIKEERGKILGGYQQRAVEERQLTKEVEELRISLGQYSARKKTIEEMESNYEGYNYPVKFIMKRKSPGIEGVVAELIDVPAGYEVAIETALGASMQNIICTDDKSAQQAIELLKENKAGRLTFLPMDSIKSGRYSHDDRMRQAEGFKGFGVECVEFDPKYQKVMEYLLGRVVVVDHMRNAVKLSKGNGMGLRYVTLEGEIINAGGAITGGKYKNKTANLLERKAEISQLEDRLITMNQDRQKNEKNLEEIRNTIAKNRSRIEELNEISREKEIEIAARDQEIRSVEAMLTDFKSSSRKWQDELDSIHTEQTNSDKAVRKLEKEIEKGREDIKETEKVIEQEMDRLEHIGGQMEELNEKITRARIDVSTCESRKNNADEIVERINSTIDELSLSMETREKELEALKREKSSLTFDHTDIESVITEKEEEKKHLETYTEELTQERGALTVMVNQLSLNKEELDEKLVTQQNRKYEADIKQAKYQTQLESMKEKLWEDFEISYIQAMDFKKEKFVMSSAIKENRQVKARIRELGEVNVGAIKEYEAVNERYGFLSSQREDITEAMDGLNDIIRDMDKTIRTRFKESFDQVVVNFEKVFKNLFGGGHAQLRLEDESDPLDSGIEIIAQPPGKALKNINLLSGGEKTMTAIALMFAVLKTKPTPFCILDEVEAALDDANIQRFAKYLKTFTEIQFALVTHKKATMEYADVLYGVTMPEQGISKILSLKMEDDFNTENKEKE